MVIVKGIAKVVGRLVVRTELEKSEALLGDLGDTPDFGNGVSHIGYLIMCRKLLGYRTALVINENLL